MGLVVSPPMPPALLTSMSSRPSLTTASSTRCSQSATLVTSVGTTMLRWPVTSSSAAVASRGPTRRPARATSAPWAASTRAIPRPIPLPAPVTTATCPATLKREIVGGCWALHGFLRGCGNSVVRALPPGQECLRSTFSYTKRGHRRGSSGYGGCAAGRLRRSFPRACYFWATLVGRNANVRCGIMIVIELRRGTSCKDRRCYSLVDRVRRARLQHDCLLLTTRCSLWPASPTPRAERSSKPTGSPA